MVSRALWFVQSLPTDRRTFLWFYGVLLLLDAALLLHYVGWRVFAKMDGTQVPVWAALGEEGLPEQFNFVKWLAAAVLLFLLWWRVRQPVAAALATVCAVLLADDSLQIHERAGGLIADGLGVSRESALSGLAEVAYWAVAGPALILLLAWAIRRSSREYALLAVCFVGLFALLGAFGVGLDFIAFAIGKTADADTALAALFVVTEFLEEGGEMIVISAIAGASAAALAPVASGRAQPVRSSFR